MIDGPELRLPMHKHLRAWRLYRNLSLEHVGNILGKKHTSVSRWERGLMKLSTDDLDALARIYGATTRQLMAPPLAADLVSELDETQEILETMDAETKRMWLAVGRQMAAGQKK